MSLLVLKFFILVTLSLLFSDSLLKFVFVENVLKPVAFHFFLSRHAGGAALATDIEQCCQN